MNLNKRSCYIRYASIISAWLIGLCLGALAAAKAEEGTPHYMLSLSSDQIPLIGMVILQLTPFAISVFLLRYRLSFLIFSVIGLKAAFYGFCFCGFMNAFKNAGWLARSLFMFSSSCSAVLLVLFWLKHLYASRIDKKALQLFFLIATFIVVVDYYIISPFTAVFY